MSQPKTQTYANLLYEHFDSNSEEKLIEGVKVLVWSGSLTKTCRSLGIPAGTEQRAMRPLLDMGCIEMVQRGVSGYPTILALRYPPTEERWAEVSDRLLTGKVTLDKLAASVREIQRQLGGADYGRALADHEERLRTLERKSSKGE